MHRVLAEGVLVQGDVPQPWEQLVPRHLAGKLLRPCVEGDDAVFEAPVWHDASKDGLLDGGYCPQAVVVIGPLGASTATDLSALVTP